MDKPITVARYELKQCCMKNISISGLPLFIVAELFREMLEEIKPLAEEQTNLDVEKWNAYLEEEQKEEEKDGDSEQAG